MAGGAIMISDMFDNALKARVDALCNQLSALIRSKPDFAAADAFQSQRQGRVGILNLDRQAFLAAAGPERTNWWPSDLGVHPALEHRTKFAMPIFPPPAARRLANDINGRVTV
jgi:hypothetical protein